MLGWPSKSPPDADRHLQQARAPQQSLASLGQFFERLSQRFN